MFSAFKSNMDIERKFLNCKFIKKIKLGKWMKIRDKEMIWSIVVKDLVIFSL